MKTPTKVQQTRTAVRHANQMCCLIQTYLIDAMAAETDKNRNWYLAEAERMAKRLGKDLAAIRNRPKEEEG